MTTPLIEQVYGEPDIYRIYVPLPNNPLKNLNCYVIKTPEKNLIIDTGFNMVESKAALLAGLAELEVEMEKTDIYATHLHSDHTGLIGEIMLPDTTVYMSEEDGTAMMQSFIQVRSENEDGWRAMELQLMEGGFPMEEIIAARATNPAVKYAIGKPYTPTFVYEGDIIKVGPYELTVIDVPGHTPGNTVLYMANEKILFSGDHILFDITPNITAWPRLPDALGYYLENLKKVRTLDIETTFPAHRSTSRMDVYQRIDQLLVHHEDRLENTLDVIRAIPGSSAYEIAAQMKWSMRGKSWAEFPVHQKWFAVGETLSHLEYLEARGKVVREKIEGEPDKYYLGDRA